MKKHISNSQSTVTSVDYDAKEQEIKDKETKKFTKWRKKFLRNLRRAGLVLETVRWLIQVFKLFFFCSLTSSITLLYAV